MSIYPVGSQDYSDISEMNRRLSLSKDGVWLSSYSDKDLDTLIKLIEKVKENRKALV